MIGVLYLALGVLTGLIISCGYSEIKAGDYPMVAVLMLVTLSITLFGALMFSSIF